MHDLYYNKNLDKPKDKCVHNKLNSGISNQNQSKSIISTVTDNHIQMQVGEDEMLNEIQMKPQQDYTVPNLQMTPFGNTVNTQPKISKVTPEIIQRTATFEEGEELPWNIANNIIERPGIVGITIPILNGEGIHWGENKNSDVFRLLDKPSIRGRRRPVLRRRSRDMSNVLSYKIWYPQNPPWEPRDISGEQVAIMLRSIDLRPSEEIRQVTLDISREPLVHLQIGALPDETTFAQDTLVHEQQHARDFQTAFSDIIEWDRRITERANMSLRDRSFTSMENLYSAIGGSADEVTNRFVARVDELERIFHGRDAIAGVWDVQFNNDTKQVIIVMEHIPPAPASP
jgi:hypothetical protein